MIKIVEITEISLELLIKLFFLNKFENGQILRNGFDLMETTFLIKPVNRKKYYRKQFCSSK